MMNVTAHPARKQLRQLWSSISTQKRLLIAGLIFISLMVTLTAWAIIAYAPLGKSASFITTEEHVVLISIFALVWVLGALALAVHYALISRPLKALAVGASHIASGEFGYEIARQRAGSEIDQLVETFNYMSKELQRYDKHNVDTLMSERNKFISEKNKLQLVLMSIADGVVVCDRDNKVQIINAAASKLFDKEAKDLLGKPLVFCTDGPDSPQICRIIQEFTDAISPQTGPRIMQIHLGERVIRLNIAPLPHGSELQGSVMIMQDITRQAELERMKNEFISNVSHELRTPITSIKSYVDTLCNHGEKLDPEIHREFLQIIDSEAERLIYLVNEVLELSKIEEESNRELELEPGDVFNAINSSIKSVNLMARDHSIDLSYSGEDNLPVVQMNRESIERCIINLLTNAIKYTPTGGKIQIGAFFDRKLQEVRIDVADNGIGIPEEELDHVFDRFYRVERKVHTIKGTGLGLTIVKKIVERQGGKVTVRSALGEGSTFSISLPVDAQAARAVA
jgi:two-component system, OmpR family, sensor histidine kinase NblS